MRGEDEVKVNLGYAACGLEGKFPMHDHTSVNISNVVSSPTAQNPQRTLRNVFAEALHPVMICSVPDTEAFKVSKIYLCI